MSEIHQQVRVRGLYPRRSAWSFADSHRHRLYLDLIEVRTIEGDHRSDWKPDSRRIGYRGRWVKVSVTLPRRGRA